MNLKYFLKVFQSEGYRFQRFFLWLNKNKWGLRSRPSIEPVWTAKAKLLYRFAIVWLAVVSLYLFFKLSFVWFVIIAAVLFAFSYWAILLAMLCLKPYEMANRFRVYYLVMRRIAAFPDVKVIGITGSFGKTSTKGVLNQLLPKSLATPKSYNTLWGIYKVVDYELDSRYEQFICEMGAFKKGDIKEFCELVKPHLVILTGINEQHLERFKKIENTVKAKFEILHWRRAAAPAIVNLDNEHIRKELESGYKNVIGYTVDGVDSAACKDIAKVTSWSITETGMEFELDYQSKTHQFKTPLVGKAHLRNIVASIVAALELGQDSAEVIKRVAKITQLSRRMELVKKGAMNILDNTYSSNTDSFRENLDTLSKFGGQKVLVTPGIVELGDLSDKVHKELGEKAASICDLVVLVGKTSFTNSLFSGLKAGDFPEEHVFWVKDGGEVEGFMADNLSGEESILFENVSDLPVNYL